MRGKVYLVRAWRLVRHKGGRQELPAESSSAGGEHRGKMVRRVLLLTLAAAVTAWTLTLGRNLAAVTGAYASATVHSLAERVINEAIAETVSEETYSGIVVLDTDSEGHVTALRTDMTLTNRLRAEVAARVIEGIDNLPASELSVPVGNLLPTQLFSGRGPCIPVKLMPLGEVETGLESQMSGAGINQTRHRILLRVRVQIGALLPGFSRWTEVSGSMVLAETVLVGGVPNTYTYLEESGRSGMEIYGDFDLSGD